MDFDWLEFMMTYGWAILITLVAIISMIFFGVFPTQELSDRGFILVDEDEVQVTVLGDVPKEETKIVRNPSDGKEFTDDNIERWWE